MTSDTGTLSIDFLAGFTIFLIAFIYVATLIPGLFIGLQSRTIDYDAVAYRTGVILVEDPGMPTDWEDNTSYLPEKVVRFGLALSKDNPNILSPQKVDQFFCSTWTYPDNYHTRAIFGDYPYRFNISFQRAGSNLTQSIGDTTPDEYGYIRRVVKIKKDSNVTLGRDTITANNYICPDNVSTDYFSIRFNCPDLLEVTDKAYQINPLQDPIMINITDLDQLGNITMYGGSLPETKLNDISIYLATPYPGNPSPDPTGPVNFTSSKVLLYIDNTKTDAAGLPVPVTRNLSLTLLPNFFKKMPVNANSQVYVVFNFTHSSSEDKYLNNTWFSQKGGYNNYYYLNTSKSFNYTYANVTPPYLQDGTLEVSVW